MQQDPRYCNYLIRYPIVRLNSMGGSKIITFLSEDIFSLFDCNRVRNRYEDSGGLYWHRNAGHILRQFEAVTPVVESVPNVIPQDNTLSPQPVEPVVQSVANVVPQTNILPIVQWSLLLH